jgi:hypothetical protein
LRSPVAQAVVGDTVRGEQATLVTTLSRREPAR